MRGTVRGSRRRRVIAAVPRLAALLLAVQARGHRDLGDFDRARRIPGGELAQALAERERFADRAGAAGHRLVALGRLRQSGRQVTADRTSLQFLTFGRNRMCKIICNFRGRSPVPEVEEVDFLYSRVVFVHVPR